MPTEASTIVEAMFRSWPCNPRWFRGLTLVVLVALVGCGRSVPAVSKADLLRRGDELAAAGRHADAAAVYQRAVAADAADGQARLKLATAYEQSGQWQLAATAGIRAADLLPGNLDAKVLAARVILPQGRYADAVAFSEDVLRQQPDNVPALLVWGTATARLSSSAWALFAVAQKMTNADWLAEQYRDLRPAVSATADREAEAAFRKALALAPDSAEAQMAFANFLWATRRFDEAEPLLLKAAAQWSNNYTLNYALGAFYVSRDRLGEAERYLEAAKGAALTGDPRAHTATKELLDLYVRQRRSADAVALLDSLAANDSSFDARLLAAEILVAEGKRADALGRLDGLPLNPNDPRILKVRAQALFAAGNLSAALAAARGSVDGDGRVSGSRFILGQILAARGQIDAAFDELREALRLDPASREIPVVLARVALDIGRNVEALEYAREAARKRPDDEEAAAAVIEALVRTRSFATAEREVTPLLAKFPSSADLHAQLGAIRAAQARLPAARAAYQRALELNPGSLDALTGTSALDLSQGQTAAARQRIDHALARYPDDQGYLLLFSRVRAAEGAASEAESALRRVLTLNPGNVDAAIILAESLAARSQAEPAVTVLEAVIAVRPLSIAAQTALATQYERMGRTADARSRYQRIVAQDPGAGPAAARLAHLLLATGGNIDVALGIVSTAKSRSPNDPEVSDALGWVQHRKGLTSIALPQFQEAVRSEPRNATYRYHLGAAYAALGQRDQARAELTRALQLNPGPDVRTQTQAAIDALRR